MHETGGFLQDLALVSCAAALITVLFQKLRQPVILGYLLAGFIISPHFSWIPLLADEHNVRTLSELGITLLMFSIGLGFSVRKFLRLSRTAGFITALQVPLSFWAGYMTGQLFGWTVQESLFTGALLTVSSSMILAKTLAEEGAPPALTELAFGIAIVEDLVAILLLAVLTAVASGAAVSTDALATTVGQLVGFLALLIAAGMLIIPRLIRSVARLERDETLLVASVGICFAVALLAKSAGYSVALGAFLAGSMMAESGVEQRVERLIRPLRDMFAAVFFVSVGMLIDPRLVADYAPAIIVLFLLLLVCRGGAIFIGAFFTGHGIPLSIKAGMSLAQIGEFSFIIAGLGVALGAADEFLYSVAVSVSVLAAFTSPWLVRLSDPLARYFDRHLPHALQTFAALYGSWLEDLRNRPASQASRTPERRLFLLMFVDTVCLAVIIIAGSVSLEPLAHVLESALGIAAMMAYWLLIIGIGLAASPFIIGIVRCARKLGALMATEVMPGVQADSVDFAAAPRRALIVTLQLAMVLLMGLLLLVVTQPFLPPFRGLIALVLVMALLGLMFWRSAVNLNDHVNAGAQMVMAALTRGAKDPDQALDRVEELLPGFGHLSSVQVQSTSPAVGRTLSELNLRGRTGANAVCIARGDAGVIAPHGDERLREGDVLALAGTHEAIAAARELLS